ncbi:MAG: hypothetical protein WCS80_00525 [Bacilli bacterium]
MVEDQKNTNTTATPVASTAKQSKKHNKGKKNCGCEDKMSK